MRFLKVGIVNRCLDDDSFCMRVSISIALASIREHDWISSLFVAPRRAAPL
jgi:hypothetical protein